MTAKGITLPNWEFQPYTAAELAALEDLAPGCLVWLLYGGAIDQTHKAQLAPFIATHHPRILFRPYATNIIQMHPVTWAGTCRDWYEAVGVTGEMIPANELNNPVEGGSEDWQAQVNWLITYQSFWKVVEPTVPLHLPALSPSGNWEAGLAAYVAAGLPKLFDAVDCHAYTDAGIFVVSATSSLYGGQTLCITEYDQTDPGRFLSNVANVADSAVYFLLGGTPDQGAYDILQPANKAYYTSFKGWQPMPTPAPSPIIVPSRQQWMRLADFADPNGQINYGLTYPALDGGIFEVVDGTYVNGTFAPNWFAAGQFGLDRTLYIFCRPSQMSGHDQAEFAMEVVTKNGFNRFDKIAFDMEDPAVPSGAGLAAFSIDLITDIKGHLALPEVPMYSGVAYRADHGLNDNAIIEANGAWWAWWREDTTPPAGWQFWQYGSGPLPGVSGNVDYDLFQGSLGQLQALGLP